MYRYIFASYFIFLLTMCINAQESKKITNLSKKEAIEIAIKNNPEINKQKYFLDAAKGRYFRDISLSPLNLSVSNEFIPNGKGFSDFDERTIEISQDFDFPTLYFARGSRVSSEINSARYSIEEGFNLIKSKVKRAYITTLAKFQLLKIAEENLNIADDFFKKAEIRYKAGEGTNLEFLTSKVQLTEANALIGTCKKEYLTALNDLLFTMGYNVQIDEQNLILTDSLSIKSYSFIFDTLIAKSLQLNPAVKKAEYSLETARISKSIAWMSLFPSFNAAYMFQSREKINDYYGISVGLSIPIWFMLDQKGQIDEADANYQMTQYEIKGIKNDISMKIKDAYIDFINDEKQLSIYQNELLLQADEIYRSANLSYQAGEITYLEFLQAKFTIINTRINYVKALFDYNEAIINLEESTGLSLE
jgi:heavy metal efflux system protein